MLSVILYAIHRLSVYTCSIYVSAIKFILVYRYQFRTQSSRRKLRCKHIVLLVEPFTNVSYLHGAARFDSVAWCVCAAPLLLFYFFALHF